MRRDPSALTVALIVLAPIGLIVAVIALTLPDGRGADSSSDGSTDHKARAGRAGEPLALKQQVASQFETLPSKVRCQSAGMWVDPTGRTRTITRCWVIGGELFENGCYDVFSEDVTIAVRENKGSKFCSHPSTRDRSP